MRPTWLALLLALAAFAACRTRPFELAANDGDDGGGPVDDLGAPADLAGDLAITFDLTTPPDLSQLGCAQLASCVGACAFGDNACVMTCIGAATPRAQMMFMQDVQCGVGWCLGVNGVAPMRCVAEPGGNVVDAPNVPPGDCNVCLRNVFSSLVGTTCTPPDDNACMPISCQTPFEVCSHN
jgi:hypothetical protein